MKFKTEEERQEALNALDVNDPEGEAKLAEYKAAEIGEEEKPPEKPPETPPKTPPEEKPPEKPPEETPVVKYEITDLKGHKKPEELLKSYDNAQDKITRQAKQIEELMSRPAETELSQKLDAAMKEIETLKTAGNKEGAHEANVDLKTLREERKRIAGVITSRKKELNELRQQAKTDPEKRFEDDYQQKLEECQESLMDANLMFIQNSESFDSMFEKLKEGLDETRKAHTDFVASQSSVTQKKKDDDALDAIFTEMDGLDDPEHKTTKPSKQLRDEWIGWRHKVATAYHGRPPRTEEEAQDAMAQLELRNPKLMQQCQLMNIPVEADDDMAKYIQKCELNLYRQGYRKNRATGKFDRALRIMVPDGKGGKVPYIMPTLKDALTLMREEEGYYRKKVDGAYQEGADGLAHAMARRDQGALTLDGKDQGKSTHDAEWALKALNEADVNALQNAYMSGNKDAFKEHNEARGILGMKPLTFD